MYQIEAIIILVLMGIVVLLLKTFYSNIPADGKGIKNQALNDCEHYLPNIQSARMGTNLALEEWRIAID